MKTDIYRALPTCKFFPMLITFNSNNDPIR